jgi:quinol monooxygenase YgiN
MNTVGLLVTLEASPGKEDELASFLEAGAEMARSEAQTNVWFALRLGDRTFGIFDAFADESGREAHLNGEIAAALMAKAPDLLAADPRIERVDVLAEKVPG